ncbi:unnamed protein product, partial [Polarella glacialis]
VAAIPPSGDLEKTADAVAEKVEAAPQEVPPAAPELEQSSTAQKAAAEELIQQPSVETIELESASNPLDELRNLRFWPKDNSSWLQIQDVVWKGHPKLASGWIRVWSRSKDSEYYVRVKDGKATFDLREAVGQ